VVYQLSTSSRISYIRRTSWKNSVDLPDEYFYVLHVLVSEHLLTNRVPVYASPVMPVIMDVKLSFCVFMLAANWRNKVD